MFERQTEKKMKRQNKIKLQLKKKAKRKKKKTQKVHNVDCRTSPKPFTQLLWKVY